jgi:hypothetical protein
MIFNITLENMNASGNFLNDDFAIILSQALKNENSALRILDLSNNEIDEVGGYEIASSLNFNETLTTLNFRNNHLNDEVGDILVTVMKNNMTVANLTLEKNFIKHKYIIEIESCCRRNRADRVKKNLPNYREEISNLLKLKDYQNNKMACINQIRELQK